MASRDAFNAEIRVPRSPTLAEPPDGATQARHRLTHVPYEPWCQSCVAHRARADAHHRDGMASEGDCPVISFDFFYTKAGESVKDEETLVAMVMIDNKTGYLGVVPLSSKAQFDLLTKELIAFTSFLGYSSIQLRCDNEPTIVQVAKLTVQARQQMGLETRFETPAAYTHGNGSKCSAKNPWCCLQLDACSTRPFEGFIWYRRCSVVLVSSSCLLDHQQIQPLQGNYKL